MKKTYRSFFCLLAVLLLSVSALPAASALFSERLYYYGTCLLYTSDAADE